MTMITRPIIEDLAARIEDKTVKGAIVSPIPGLQAQEGPNCGFYALSIVMDYWKARTMSDVSFPARKRDLALQGREAGESQARSLRNIGKEVGALDFEGARKISTGGVFTAEQLAVVARATQKYEARVVTEAVPAQFILKIYQSVMAGIPVIVAFDQVKGDPKSDQGGQHSHWGVIFGCVRESDHWEFLATHGHIGYYRWAAVELQKSNFALNGTRRAIPEEAKVKVVGMEGDKGVRVARPHWRSVAELEKFEAQKPANVKVEYVQKTARRPAQSVLQNLAHQFICVYPPGVAQ